MKSINNLSKVIIAIIFTIAALFTIANDDCAKPKAKDYSMDEINCISEDFVKLYSEDSVAIADKNGKAKIEVRQKDKNKSYCINKQEAKVTC